MSDATERRIVVEHPDGRRVSVPEGQFDDARANPFNFDRPIVESGPSNRSRVQAGRPPDDHLSLQQEGFRPVMAIHGEACTQDCPDDCPGYGCEVPL